MYPLVVNSHKWMEKLNMQSSVAGTLLNGNSMKRSYNNASNKRKRRSPNYTPANVDHILIQFDRKPAEVQVRIWRPFGANAVMHVSGRLFCLSLFAYLICNYPVF